MEINFSMCNPNRKIGNYMIIDQGGGSPQHFNDFLINKLKSYDKNNIVVEVGVFGGGSLLRLYEIINNPECIIYGIDKWDNQKSMNGITHDKYNNENWEKYIGIQKFCYENLCNIIKEYKYNIKLIKLEDTGLMDHAADDFQDSSIDFIHIDGDHSYEAVTSDCLNYFPKMKKDGIIFFDDWAWPQTKKAIIDFTKKKELLINVINGNKCYVIC